MVNVYSVVVFASGLMGILFQFFAIGTKYWLVIRSVTTSVTPMGSSTIDVSMKMGLIDIDACVNLSNGNRTCQTMTKDQMVDALPVSNPGGNQQMAGAGKQTAQAAVKVLLGDFDHLPALTVLALLSSILGLVVFTFQYCRCCPDVKTRFEIASLLFWLVAVALLASSVGIAGHLNSFLANVYTMVSNVKIPTKPGYDVNIDAKVTFPYSVLLSVALLASSVGIAGHLNSFLANMYTMVSNVKIPTKPGYDVNIDAKVTFPYSVLLSGIGMGLCFLNIVAIVIDVCVKKFKRSTDYWKYGRVHLAKGHDKVELLQDCE